MPHRLGQREQKLPTCDPDKTQLLEGKVDWRGRIATKDKHGGQGPSSLILGTFACENMASLVLGVTLVTYFNGVMHYDVADAATQVTNYSGTSYILTVLVAILADTYIGRFKAVLISCWIEFLGLGLLAFQAHYSKYKPPQNCNILDPTSTCEKVGGKNAAFLFIALYLVALGSAGIKSALPSHGADQFDENDKKEALQMSSFFNWLLLAVCIGGSISTTFIVWIQENKGWDWGFFVSTMAMFLGAIIFCVGLPWYRIFVIKGSSAITEIFQVYVAAIRNRNLQLPEDSADLYEIDEDNEAAIPAEFLPHTDTYKFLDKAAIQTSQQQYERPNHWKLCRVTQVENAKILLSMIPVFCCTIIMTLCLAQLQTFSIQQGFTMDTRITNKFHIPPASLPIIPIIFLIIIIPVYDQIIVPILRKFTGIPTGITYLQRVGVGLVLSALSMTAASILEVKRKQVARDNNMLDAIPILQPLPISVFWLSIQFFIFGIADMFTYVGLLEFFYSQAPKELKSVSSCFLWTSMSIGYFLSSIVVKVVNKATKKITNSGGWLVGNNFNRNHLNLFYLMLAVLSMVNFGIYLIVASRYKYRVQKSASDQDDSRVYALMEMKKSQVEN
ncbi:PREDICTED: protein NRT1/ PTR FAMILY 4.5-like [Nicotiana attenuata]|uniref:protein NRT1/ PTR FAMILY 4.5-like n=1 Tax=Nicotiana attenuata TaxID=49451 RepID=UPI0009055FC0|nr:PREDICTED: protein NRT1/ PTR FAMILY 4.5-like [Nicotiana attenuata]